MHRIVIGWVIYSGRHCRRANIFYLPKPGIEPRTLDLQPNTLPRRCKSRLLPRPCEICMDSLVINQSDFSYVSKYSNMQISVYS